MEMKYFPNILLVAATGRNLGKTTLVCNIIESFKKQRIVAVKISPHFHKINRDQENILEETQEYVLIEEDKHDTAKDSSRMKAAGAKRVFFLMVKDAFLEKAFERIIRETDTKTPIIVESAALVNVLKPAVMFLLVKRGEDKTKANKNSHLFSHADQIIVSDFTRKMLPDNLEFKNGIWMLKS